MQTTQLVFQERIQEKIVAETIDVQVPPDSSQILELVQQNIVEEIVLRPSRRR